MQTGTLLENQKERNNLLEKGMHVVSEENKQLKEWNSDLKIKLEQACKKNIEKVAALRRKSSIGCQSKDSVKDLCDNVERISISKKKDQGTSIGENSLYEDDLVS